MKALVIKSTGKWYRVLEESSGKEFDARVRGKLKLKGFRSTNPIAVVDYVDLEKKDEDFLITKIHPRKNFLLRKSTNLSKRSHVIASNIDQVLVICSLVQPETSFTFIDRILATATAFDIPAIVVLNKTDLIDQDSDEAIDAFTEFCEAYESAGYQIILCSAKTSQGLQKLKDIVKGKVSLLAGHSGVGKSSLVNLIEPGLNLKTSEISDYHQTGKHTTTFAEMIKLKMKGFLIDTPGIRGFGIIDIDKKSLSHFFPEMEKRLPECKFNNCQHINEPNCAVIEAVEKAEIAYSRYRSYLTILESDDDEIHRGKDHS